MLLRKNSPKRKGQALLEYALLIAGVGLVGLVSVSVLGHKISDMIAAVATVLPGAQAADNNPIYSGRLIETTVINGVIELDLATIMAQSGKPRLADNILGSDPAGTGFGGLIAGP